MDQPLPTRGLIERLTARLSPEDRKVQRGSDASTSLRVPEALSGPLTGASFIAGIAAAASLSDSPYPRPGAPPEDVRRYFRRDPGAARISVVGQLISAASLGRFTASVARL